jgi:hypothetical protein
MDEEVLVRVCRISSLGATSLRVSCERPPRGTAERFVLQRSRRYVGEHRAPSTGARIGRMRADEFQRRSPLFREGGMAYKFTPFASRGRLSAELTERCVKEINQTRSFHRLSIGLGLPANGD